MASLLGPDDPQPFTVFNRDATAPLLLLCDHASRVVPRSLDNLGLPDAEWGEVVAAAVILRSGMHLDAEGLRRHCRQGLTGYKTPSHIWFVDAMPRTPVGKVRKPDLAKQFMERR